MIQIKDLLTKIGIRAYKIRPKGSTQFLKKKYQNKKITGIEIGVWEAENALSILQNLNIEKLYLIDPYHDYPAYKVLQGDKYIIETKGSKADEAMKKAKSKLKKYQDKIEWIRDLSDDAIKKIRHTPDFVYIDGNHSYEFVKRDLNNYYKILRNGGVLAGDDINIKDILLAVTEFCKENNTDFITNYSSEYGDLDYIIIKKE